MKKRKSLPLSNFHIGPPVTLGFSPLPPDPVLFTVFYS